MTTQFTKDVIFIIRNIPSGKVLSYGAVARLAGHPRAARQVTRILHSCSKKYQLPWHRVVGAQGRVMHKDLQAKRTQETLLEEEGIKLPLDFDKCLWDIASMQAIIKNHREKEVSDE